MGLGEKTASLLITVNACISVVEVPRVRFGYRKACWRLVDVRRVSFDYRNMCWRLVEVWIVRFDYTSKRLGGMRFGESVLTTVKRVGGLKKLEVRFDNRKACKEVCKGSDSPFGLSQSVLESCRSPDSPF